MLAWGRESGRGCLRTKPREGEIKPKMETNSSCASLELLDTGDRKLSPELFGDRHQ